MIDTISGEFKLDNFDFTLAPTTVLAHFTASGIPLSAPSPAGPWSSFNFDAVINSMRSEFFVCFKHDRLSMFGWRPLHGPDGEEWGKLSGQEQKTYLHNWLASKVGTVPSTYAWGELNLEEDTKGTGD